MNAFGLLVVPEEKSMRNGSDAARTVGGAVSAGSMAVSRARKSVAVMTVPVHPAAASASARRVELLMTRPIPVVVMTPT